MPHGASTTEDVNIILTQKSLQQICYMLFDWWMQSVINLNPFYETQNKIGPDFKIGLRHFL